MVMTVMMMMTMVTMTMINISIIELTLHLVGAIILPAIPDVIANELSGTWFPSKNEKCFYNFPKHILTNRFCHLLPGDAIRGVLAFELMSSVLARCLVLKNRMFLIF